MIIDADMHVMEPANLWESAGLPVVGWGWNGVSLQPTCFVNDAEQLPDAPKNWPVDDDAYAPGAPAAHLAFAAERGFDTESTVEAMHAEGIDLAVLYPTRGLAAIATDRMEPKFLFAIASVYNEWIRDYCKAANGRLRYAALVPMHDVDLAISLAATAAKDGAVALVTRPNPIRGKNLDHPDYDRFYSAVESLGLPLCLHEGTGAHQDTLGLDRASLYLTAHAMSHPFEMMHAAMCLTVGGVLQRHPALRVGLLEAGAGWAPWWMDRLDDHVLGLFGPRELPGYEGRPGKYFKRQCFVTMDPGESEDVARIVDLGYRVCFASDFPHGDSLFPNSVDTAMSGMREDVWQSVCTTSPKELYSL